MKEGETVLITGPEGGVGTMAVQIVSSLGACVLGTSSPRNHDHLRSPGAAEVIYSSHPIPRVKILAVGFERPN